MLLKNAFLVLTLSISLNFLNVLESGKEISNITFSAVDGLPSTNLGEGDLEKF